MTRPPRRVSLTLISPLALSQYPGQALAGESPLPCALLANPPATESAPMSAVFNFTFVPWFRSVAPYIHTHRGKRYKAADV